MAEHDEPAPTLASLRLGTARRRSAQKQEIEPLFGGLFEAMKAAAPVVEQAPVKAERPLAAADAAERRVWTVRALVSDVRQQVEQEYADVWVEGEISNCRPAPSGHVYFTLKDGEAQLPVVLFRRQAQLMRFRPKDGDEVRTRGRVSVYESRGQMQLIAETVELRGAGALLAAFERLKARLLAEGLFEAGRKRPLPAFPKCIGVVTSTSGAVIRDIVTIARRRHATLNLLIYPAVMQGSACARTVVEGIRWFNAHPERVDVIVIARGGGSAEDLAGFNDEGLARAIAGSALPVVSAVGHETDYTIADFVADLRAATPSAAAELITAAQHRIQDRLEALERRARRAIQYHVLMLRQQYGRLSAEAVLAGVRDGVSRREQRVDDLRFGLESAMRRRMGRRATRLEALTARLHRQDGRRRLAVDGRRLAAAEACLVRAGAALIARRRARLERAATRLEALSPLAVLNRGYALVYTAEGTLLRDADAVQAGQAVRARLARGSLTATVTDIMER